MFLQATVDAANYDVADKLLSIYATVPEIDIIEMGAPMVTHYGVAGADWFYKRVPYAKKLYVDTKIIDFPQLELTPFIEMGARRFSATPIMNDTAFRQLAMMKVEHGLDVLITLMGYPLDKIPDRVAQLQELGFDTFIAHGAGATQDEAFADLLHYLDVFAEYTTQRPRIVVAGGINPSNAVNLQHYGLTYEGVIVGRGIATDPDPRQAAKDIIKLISK